jgi:hypothetical protein
MGLTQNSKMWALPYVNHEVILILSLNIGQKIPVHKNQGWEPIHQKYKANESTSRHNSKKKRKQTIKKKKKKGEKP